MSELRDLQRSFAAAMCQPAGAAPDASGIDPPAALAVYRNNAHQAFERALASTYPVLGRRVGEDYFRQLAREYEAAHPSRHGDLHWVGEEFPAWLAAELGATEYAWLADLARLEWACEAAAVAAHRPPATLAALAEVPTHALGQLRFTFQASLSLVDSPWPLWSVWRANQPDADGASVDLAAGGEACVVACGEDRVAVYRLERADFELLRALMEGRSIAQAMDAARADGATLQRLLGWAFGAGVVVAFSPSARA